MKKLLLLAAIALIAGCAHQQASVKPELIYKASANYCEAIAHIDSLEAAGILGNNIKDNAERGLYLRRLHTNAMAMWLRVIQEK